MPLPLLALPVIHSAGGWIASAGGSYIAGTLSTTWAGAFITGNACLMKGLAAAGIAGLATAATTTEAAIAAAPAALGLAPATMLGLTPAGWAAIGITAAAAAATGAGIYAYKAYKQDK